MFISKGLNDNKSALVLGNSFVLNREQAITLNQ